MANCIDCLHFEVCQYDEQERAETNLESSYRDISKDIADGCRFFKNKADFVKIPCRCKDCKYYSVSHLACRNPHHNGTIGIDGYCSYGARQVDK